MAMRATYVPGPAEATRVERLVVTVLAGHAGGGELVVYLKHRRPVRAVLSAAHLRAVLERWTTAALAGEGELEISE
jgi:hypothetical protein